MNKRVKKILKNPLLLFESLGHRGFFYWMSDEIYLKILFRIRMKKKLNLENPLTFSEKLQWLKLFNRNELYTSLVDKYEVKKYVEKIIGKKHIIPTIGVFDKFDDINFDSLPNQFVLKCTHDSGGVIICKDKSKFDFKKSKRIISRNLKHNFYDGQREWPYKNVKPRIIIEKYMTSKNGTGLVDYKFFCFDGKAKIMFIANDRNTKEETKFDFYDMQFNHLDIINGHPNKKEIIQKPIGFEKMIEYAEKLSKNIPHVRVDFYDIDGDIYFGEMTFFHWSGLVSFEPEYWDIELGKMLSLPKKNN